MATIRPKKIKIKQTKRTTSAAFRKAVYKAVASNMARQFKN